jgi:hypothetical protein
MDAETPAAVDGGHQWQPAPPGGYQMCGRCGVYRFAYYASDRRRSCADRLATSAAVAA